MAQVIPIVMDAGALSDAARKQSLKHAQAAASDRHDHAAESAQPLAGPPPVYVEVAGRRISEAAIAHEMQHHRADDPHRARDAAARALVVRELLQLEIERLGIASEAHPEGSESVEEACIRVLLEREAPVPTLDAAACQQYFEANRQRLRQPDRAQVRHILLAAAPSDLAGRSQAFERGEALIAELREHPQRFTELAMRHSDCPSRDAGGELGWIGRGDTTPEFERQLFMLKPGLAPLTVESRWGHHVVMIDTIERGEPLDYAEAQPKIAAYLETQARQNAIHQYLQLLAERYPVRGVNLAADAD